MFRRSFAGADSSRTALAGGPGTGREAHGEGGQGEPRSPSSPSSSRSSDGAVLTEYRGLTVTQLGGTAQRRSASDATFAVVKNTLTKQSPPPRRAWPASSTRCSPARPRSPSCKGDVVEAAKGLRDFSRANPLLVIKGGVLDGKGISPAEIEQARRPGAARGAAGQAGRRDEGVHGQGRGRVQGAAGPDGPAGRGARAKLEAEGGAAAPAAGDGAPDAPRRTPRTRLRARLPRRRLEAAARGRPAPAEAAERRAPALRGDARAEAASDVTSQRQLTTAT